MRRLCYGRGVKETIGARAIARDAVTTRIAGVALDLFEERGFAAVTMEDVARSAGVSVRSVHRYFPSKEDLVVGDPTPTAVQVEQAFAASAADGPVWSALRAAFEPLVRRAESNRVDGRRVLRIVASTGSLRARNLEKHIAWAERLVPLVADRLEGAPSQSSQLRAQSIVHMAIACFDVALTAWARDEDADVRALLDHAFESATRL
jgi:AcrR family transcriptional regulator